MPGCRGICAFTRDRIKSENKTHPDLTQGRIASAGVADYRATKNCKGAKMILYPAIDLKDGKAVRLLRGDMEKATVFNDDPAAQALEFVAMGCEWLHLVDLNGAFAGAPVNAEAVETILKQAQTPTQLGGGIRDMATIEMWLSKGLSRVILGTVAVERPDLVREAARI